MNRIDLKDLVNGVEDAVVNEEVKHESITLVEEKNLGHFV